MAAFSFRFPSLLLVLSLGVAGISGCHVTTNKNGKDKNVDIGTPFGSMSVKTNEDAVNSNLGISAYPGAALVRDGKDNDAGAADVNMSFGSFHLGVVARNYQTADKSDKVFAFYRKDLSKYGDVIECDGNRTIGSPARTSQGLTCSESENNHMSSNSHSDGMELRSGSPAHQRIVAVENRDGGTRIALLKLDLPSSSHSHEDKESE